MNEEEHAVFTKYGHLTTEQQEDALQKLKHIYASHPDDANLRNEIDNLVRLTEGYPPFGNRTF